MTKARNTEPSGSLLVQDNPFGARVAEEALRESEIHNNLYHVKDNVEAMPGVHTQKEFAGVPDPILLDLPREEDREVSAETKENARVKQVPMVLITSSAETVLVKTYCLHANVYDVRSKELDRFVEFVWAIEDYCFSIVKLPQDRG